MKPDWKWIIGIAFTLLVIGSIAAPFFMHLFWGYGMMSGYGYGPSMMGGGFGFGWLFSSLIQLGVLTLIVLGIIWLVRELQKQDQNKS